jgi:SAM-dependent methyltransferase
MAITQRTRVDDGNLAQAQAWDGGEGAYWAAHADRFDRSMAGYRERFQAAAAVRRGDRVLDIGCGAGQTTCDAARAAVDGQVLGVDLSARMLQVARARAASEGLRHAQFEQGDAQVHPFGQAAYDVVLSRTGAMFFSDPVAAFRNLAAATRRGGRLVLLTWRSPAENDWIRAILGALSGSTQEAAPAAGGPGPFSLADPDRTRAVLGAAGWTRVRLEPVQATMWFGTDVEDALGFLVGLFAWRLDGLGARERGGAVDRLRRSLAEHAGPAGVELGSSAWLTTAQRELDR